MVMRFLPQPAARGSSRRADSLGDVLEVGPRDPAIHGAQPRTTRLRETNHGLLAGFLLLCSLCACGRPAQTETSATTADSEGATDPTGGSETGTSDTTTDTTGELEDPCDAAAGGEGAVWDPGQPDIHACQVRGLREYRAIIHLHSPHSHDACDGDPQPGGMFNETCLEDLRQALCTTRIDVAFLSDHPAHATEATIEEMALARGDDELVTDEQGRVVGNWVTCSNGHRVLLIPGVESGSMMPLGLHEHPPAGTYDSSSPETFAAAKAAGAVAWVAHTEGRSVDELATLGLDGIEFYQLHANLDPEIREEDLGLDPNGFLTDVLPFFYPADDTPPQPDLAALAFVRANEPSIEALESIGQQQRLGLSAGTDAHQNVFPAMAPDGERIDSYRRMIRWFNNRLRIDGELSVDAAKQALRSAHNHIVFESFGTPQDFDFIARRGEEIAEMGDEVTLGQGWTIEATLPRLDLRSPQSTAQPDIRGVVYRADAEGRSVIAEWDEGTVSHSITQPGVYRVEVMITPHHLTSYLGSSAALADQEIIWVYSAALFVRP